MIHIRMLGEFTITYQDKIISDQVNRSKKVWTLLEYLIAFHNKEISQFTLIDLLWPDGQNEDPLNSLKTLLHRARGLLEDLEFGEKKLLVHRRDTYAWNNSLPFDIDIELFEDICHKVSNPSLPAAERIELSLTAFRLYRGEFLPKSSNESWAISLSTHYQALYTKLVYDLCELLAKEQNYNQIVEIASTAAAFDPYDEQLHFLLIDSLYRSGKQKQALAKYESVMSLFYDKFGITPSGILSDLYQKIVKTENATETDLTIIQDELKEQDAQQRAYQCEYSVFQNLYRVEARSATRSGLSVFLCLVTIECNSKKEPSALIAKAMSRMSETIAVALRSGDVFSRYSVNQYIIMLPAASYENCTMIGERILRKFDLERPKYNVIVSYTLKHLEPSSFR